MSKKDNLGIPRLLTLPSYQSRITNQLHRLGGSYDWSRVAFTMNEASRVRSPNTITVDAQLRLELLNSGH